MEMVGGNMKHRWTIIAHSDGAVSEFDSLVHALSHLARTLTLLVGVEWRELFDGRYTLELGILDDSPPTECERFRILVSVIDALVLGSKHMFLLSYE